MSPPKICVVAPSALVVVLALCSIVDATVVSTCKAAASVDKRVNYDFCVLELSKHHDSPDADTWGLAKVATGVGAGNAENAVADIKAKLAKPGMGDKTRAALEQCQKLYTDVLAKAAIQSPLTQYNSYTVKIGIICAAITDLIK
ncbi:hypothetical protein C2845_PM11G06940 [Panicum miliaceum]|uniref:Pectinesterase inhibitor domain-containing protein n=1 Tax=Panicum miliaceum TaxID=4540 RepID=A0A3L6RQQ0_PANMI|nr:hypothetical protein C2845_PM11G06940 [Panicum miliaceum]